jgi:hypothetical protein
VTGSIHEQLAPILGVIEILGPTALRFAGGPVLQFPDGPAPAQLPGHPFHPLSDNALVRTLQGVLYRRCYSHPFDPTGGPPYDAYAQPQPELIDRLAAANAGREGWDRGWRVYSAGPTGDVSLVKGDRQRTAAPGEYVLEGEPFRRPVVGSEVSVRTVPDSRTLQPGFYFTFGDTPADVWDEYHTVRYYVNARPELTIDLLRHLTAQLNRYQVAFKMKALSVPAWYTRSDSLVLYVARRDHGIVARIIGHAPRAVLTGLAADTPLFTKRLCPGVGLAEDPRTGESFGMHRCRLVAEGVADAWAKGLQTVSARARAVIKRFAANGLDVERPYLQSRWTVDLFEPIRFATEGP